MRKRSSKQSVNDTVKKSCAQLEQSNKTFEDIYNIVFFRDGVLCETSGESGIISYTYQDFRKYVNSVSAMLYKDIGTDNYVAIYGKNSYEWTVAFWAILKSGNKPFLVNMLHTKEAMRSALDTLGCEIIFCLQSPSGLGKKDILLSDFTFDEDITPLPTFANSIVLSTSGTTLSEKLCIYSGEVVSNQILNATDIVKNIPSIQGTYEGKLKMLMMLPLYHIFGLEASYLWFLFFGAIFVFPPSLAPSALLNVAKRHKVTHIFSVPLLWQNIEKSIKQDIASKDEKLQAKFYKAINKAIKLHKINPSLGEFFARRAFKVIRNKTFGNSVKFCISGGAAISHDTLHFINALGYPLYNGYGMTEIGIVCANFSRAINRRLTESIGSMFSSVQADIDENNHLIVKGSSLCRSMIVDGEEIALDDWFDTGDIVERNSYGDFVILGRASDLVINADGENLNPDIAQNELSLPSAVSFSVLGNERNDELILLVQILKDMKETLFEKIKEEITREIASLPSAYQIRKVYYTTDSLIDSDEIKVSRKKLRRKIETNEIRIFDDVMAKKEISTASNSAIEKVLKEIFSEVLNLDVKDIERDMHFMNDLGGSSLGYYDVMYRIEERFNIKLDFQGQNFGYTLSDFERIVKEKTGL